MSADSASGRARWVGHPSRRSCRLLENAVVVEFVRLNGHTLKPLKNFPTDRRREFVRFWSDLIIITNNDYDFAVVVVDAIVLDGGGDRS